MRKSTGLLLLLSFASIWTASFRLMKPILVVIDPGHGGKDPGALGKIYKEKDIALSVSLKLADLLKKDALFRPVLTRDSDVFVELIRRADTANKLHADLFLSIHCNANQRKDIYGSETYALGEHKTKDNLAVVMRENSSILLEEGYQRNYDGFDPNSEEAYIIFSLMQHAYLKQSLRLAKRIEEQMSGTAKRQSRGVKQAGFLVLWRTSMPAVLCEIGFITNPAEEKYLASQSGQEYIAQSIYQALRQYVAAGQE
ncbi:MAG: N-acetylmuramoyl-L-alanine amidase [Bacteroidia bacterium]|nr:N-acetylmuramoyl-L-alanine amidase [Bacteroidia bacterium]MCX7652326.1 N-acetylmuramoyl-L-alanine amidase [Bacteroidia bacterium]MDW8417652.1 N-acetylmuramoyl-L-alanine amidase [Bacteroidia bacterium]